MKWGDGETIVRLVEMIGRREGLGDILAEGVKRAAERFGGEAEKLAVHVKGLELPMWDPRGQKGLALSYAVSNRGGCHLQSLHDAFFEKENVFPEVGVKEPVSRYSSSRLKTFYTIVGEQVWGALADSLILCKYIFPFLIKLEDVPEMVKAATGWNLTIKELMLIAERAINLCRAFNVREGIARKDDILPRKFEELAVTGGDARGQTYPKATLDTMLDDYYELRGWNKNGIPKKEKLEELGLGWVAADLQKHGYYG